ncbi:MAG: polysaccharide deacetylase family protein [Pseudomonadota bacterium]
MSALRLNWQPSPAIAVFFAVVVGGIALTVWQPQWWCWTLGVAVACHMGLTIAGLLPRSRLLGPNWVRLPASAAMNREICITIDDGPDPAVTPQVLNILESHGARATFFCIGRQAQRHPELCREIVQRGHAVENHTQNHPHLFSLFGPRGIYREIQAAQQTLGGITGRQPVFFRPVAGLRNLLLDPILAYCGLRLVSWTRRGYDTRENDAELVFQRLTKELRAGDILLLHDGNAARTNAGTPVILEVLPRLLDRIAAARLRAVTLHSTLS